MNCTSLSQLNNHDPPTKRIKLSVDNLLSNEILNSTVLQNGNLNCSTILNSPYHSTNQRVSSQFTVNSKTPNQLLQNNKETASNQSTSAQSKKNSSNKCLLFEYLNWKESPVARSALQSLLDYCTTPHSPLCNRNSLV